jgi:hypothetical protein
MISLMVVPQDADDLVPADQRVDGTAVGSEPL